VGISGNDTFKGSVGSDTIEVIGIGNTVDYKNGLDAAVSLRADGMVTKRALKASYGTDKLINIQKVISGSGVGLLNSFDASAITSGSTDIDLKSCRVIARNRTASSVLNITVANFRVVDGTQDIDRIAGGNDNNRLYSNRGNDRLISRAGNDYLVGGSGNDILYGRSGDDVLLGAITDIGSPNSRGLNEKDYLLGGTGADTFVLGDVSGSYYFGDGDRGYAQIQDFSASDKRDFRNLR
jgi:Ca2+-binding RTX toxin-like protein